MMTRVPGGARQHEPRTAVGNAIGHWLHVRRMGGFPARPNVRQVTWGCLFGFAIFVIYLAGSHLVPGLRAARGAGIRGEWTARQCTGSGNGGECSWYGPFRLPDGKVTMPWVIYTGSEAAVHPGWTTPALDTGSADEVYPVHGSKRWIHDVIGLIGGAVTIIALLWRALVVRRRRRRMRPGTFVPA
jgi:hypothetical protein